MFTVEQVIEATGGKLIGGPAKRAVRGVSIDSRIVAKGQMFIAVKGEIFDGHDFIIDVVEKGVRVVVVHKPVKTGSEKVSVILVKDTTRALGDLARAFRLRFKTPVIAVTGSAGKTTTKEMIAAVLARKYKVLKNEGTQNNHIGVPLTLLKLKRGHQITVLECGSNQPGDIPWLTDVARPDVAVFTNVGESHLEKLKTTAGVLKEKWALVSPMRRGQVILNADDPLLAGQARRARKGLKVTTYGIDHQAKVMAKNITLKGGRCLQFTWGGKTIKLNSCGINNVYNSLAAAACGSLFRVPAAAIASALGRFEFPQGRGQILRLGRGWLVDDAYNANPVSMRGALQTLDALEVAGKKIFVAADMLELGGRARSLHRAIGEAAAASSTDVLITVGGLARFMADEARRCNKDIRVFACKDVEGAQQHLARILNNGDAVLVKGSRRMKMEQVVDFLLASPGS